MSFDMANAEDQQLNNNMKLIKSNLCYLLDYEEPRAARHAACDESSAANVLQELNLIVNDLTLDANAPQFEFHRYGCPQTEAMQKRLVNLSNSGAKKKSNSNASISAENNLVSRHIRDQQQKENIQNREECGSFAIELNGDCIERNPVLRLMTIFKSLHEHLNTELPSNQLNSMPSDYIFDLPKKCSLPSGCNVRHHAQVLCTKLERFHARQRRILETNRHFDYTRYTECDELLNKVFNDLQVLKAFTKLELRQRASQLLTKVALDNAAQLEKLLLELLDHLKAAHIHVFIFNWEMDLEYRYSSAMKATLHETNKRVLQLATVELQAPRALDSVEQRMVEHYQLGNVISCAKQHEDFLTALLESPENYFPPEIIGLCDPPKIVRNLPPNPNLNVHARLQPLDFVGELPPLSPPRVNRRSHVPRINRA
ncbi:protein bag-of-marbles [Drosophila grimshawi]|uniref:GH14604 n=1 Tax=Drosophila grimshawi TaxID=7222 RepID=B4JV14_DROGR|nr:protein bag-of-marbles [Drosophila grimshawi]EDV91334.1 GH14604 [Drosophila grimshawi]